MLNNYLSLFFVFGFHPVLFDKLDYQTFNITFFVYQSVFSYNGSPRSSLKDPFFLQRDGMAYMIKVVSSSDISRVLFRAITV